MFLPGAKKSQPCVQSLTVILLSSPKKRKGRWGSYGTSFIISEREKLNPETQKRAGRGTVEGLHKSLPESLNIPSGPIFSAQVNVGRGSLE